MLIERLFSTWAARFYHNNPGDFCRNQLTLEKIEKYRSAFDAMSAKTQPTKAAKTANESTETGGTGDDMSRYMKAVETVHEGYLTKKGEKRKSWKKRYFVIERSALSGDQLIYYEDKGKKEKGRINLTTCQAVQMSMEDILLFTLMAKKADGTDREYVFRAPDEETVMMWFNKINTSLAMHLSAKADEAAEAIQKSGEVKFSDLFALVKSLVSVRSFREFMIQGCHVLWNNGTSLLAGR
eukprot:SAG31_NODE_1006_length_10432_cov_3.272718_4_plen_239_part_00